MNCPCQSGKDYDVCCGRFISHRLHAENAELLMRSRYSAYVLNNIGYIDETWHPDFRPINLYNDQSLHWIRLDLMGFMEQGDSATVEFEARLLKAGRVNALHEKSHFVLEQGRWLYTEGEMMAPTFKPWKPSKNEACPCGSGLKFKRCCSIPMA